MSETTIIIGVIIVLITILVVLQKKSLFSLKSSAHNIDNALLDDSQKNKLQQTKATSEELKRIKEAEERDLKLLKAASKIPRDHLTVLAVDDDVVNLKLWISYLMKSGKITEVIEANNGSDALDILKSRDDIDLVLLNIIMPIMGGMEMLKIVRADDNFQNLPIIIVTSTAARENEAKELGADGFMVKPVRGADLMQTIAAVLLK